MLVLHTLVDVFNGPVQDKKSAMNNVSYLAFDRNDFKKTPNIITKENSDLIISLILEEDS
jgi:hypothetical protein